MSRRLKKEEIPSASSFATTFLACRHVDYRFCFSYSFKVVGPFLHHPAAWLQIFRVVVRRLHVIIGTVSELKLDVLALV